MAKRTLVILWRDWSGWGSKWGFTYAVYHNKKKIASGIKKFWKWGAGKSPGGRPEYYFNGKVYRSSPAITKATDTFLRGERIAFFKKKYPADQKSYRDLSSSSKKFTKTI